MIGHGSEYVNITEVAAKRRDETGVSRRISHWLENKRTQEAIAAISAATGIPAASLIISARGGMASGGYTLVHEDLAKEFVWWLDNSVSKRFNEASIRDALAKKLKGQVEVKVFDTCKIDILTSTEIIEVKEASRCYEALGQVLIYGQAYPEHRKRVHLTGTANIKMLRAFETVCKQHGVVVTWE